MNKLIRVRGAQEHNLKNLDVDIPRDRFVVITGLSGSGKSSLAFDTIYAEGQRRYVESLSAYARQFLQLMQKPEVESIEGLSPAISIEQKTTSRNPRSTVGTVTELYDYLRLLFSRIGIPYSPATGKPIESQSVSKMADRILAMPPGSKLLILAPTVRGRKGEYKKEFSDLAKKGFTRVKVDGDIFDIDSIPELDKNRKHDIEVVIDRIVVTPNLGNRLADSLETALSLSDGIVFTENVNSGERLVFSSKFACPISGFSIEEIEPRLFSFNNPFGACPRCDGLGSRMQFDPNLIIPDSTISIEKGAILPWTFTKLPYYKQTLQSICKHYNENISLPWRELSKEVQDVILYGSTTNKIDFSYDDGTDRYTISKQFDGVIPNLLRRWSETENTKVREELQEYQNSATCESCKGHRLKAEALAVKIGNIHIGDYSRFSIREASDWTHHIESQLSIKQKKIAGRILKEINERLRFLLDVGLDYITLDRGSGTLSGGESQRIRLASQIGSGLTGVLYVLDEPSIGLHQRDNKRLLKTLQNLRDLGNSVIVVEHDEEAILEADHVIDMGPKAGVHGGEIVAQGSPKEIMESAKSLTGLYLTGLEQIHVSDSPRQAHKDRYIKILGASQNNLKSISTSIPLGSLTCVTGVSGSGKSSLIIDTLHNCLAKQMNQKKVAVGTHKAIHGIEFIDKIVEINQSPIGRTPRSNPSTYTGTFGPIRDWFASLPESKARGYAPGRFSFNVKGGRCEACKGDGLIKIEMHFLPDIYVQCDQCKGERYNRETLEVKYKGQSIADVLNMTVEDGEVFFKALPAIRDKLNTLSRVGLSYIKIGQQATTLSGGEAQRIKLAKELARRATGKTLYILDEPTTGLHFHDIKQLLEVLHSLVNGGNTVIIIEHNLDVIKTADWIIDLGPEGGDKGGNIVVEGTLQHIIKCKNSYTGRYLAKTIRKSSQINDKTK